MIQRHMKTPSLKTKGGEMIMSVDSRPGDLRDACERTTSLHSEWSAEAARQEIRAWAVTPELQGLTEMCVPSSQHRQPSKVLGLHRQRLGWVGGNTCWQPRWSKHKRSISREGPQPLSCMGQGALPRSPVNVHSRSVDKKTCNMRLACAHANAYLREMRIIVNVSPIDSPHVFDRAMCPAAACYLGGLP